MEASLEVAVSSMRFNFACGSLSDVSIVSSSVFDRLKCLISCVIGLWCLLVGAMGLFAFLTTWDKGWDAGMVSKRTVDLWQAFSSASSMGRTPAWASSRSVGVVLSALVIAIVASLCIF